MPFPITSNASPFIPPCQRCIITWQYLACKQDDKGEGLKDLNQAIQLDPRYIAAYMKRGSVYNDTANYDAAIADYNYVLKLNHNYYQAYKDPRIFET